MSKTNKLPTMKDVAIKAGVSLGTVSKVFNGIPVGNEYKSKVENAAKELGYQVNVYARGLRTQRTNCIALIVPNVIHPFYSNMVDHCCQILHKKNYRTLLATTDYDPDEEQQCVDMVQQNKVDGIIAITYNPKLEVKEDLPFVIIDRKFKTNVSCVSSDNFAGGQLAAEKLIENGCTNLLFLGISSTVPGEADKRPLGFSDYCNTHKIPHTIHRLYDIGDEEILKFIDKNINNGKFNFDGIFCNNDTIATHVIEHLKQLKISIPEDVQIIGYDGIKRFGSDDYYCSTIKQPLREMAQAACDILLSEDKVKNSSLVCLPVTYCYGGTTLH